jgi:hypothetical protein
METFEFLNDLPELAILQFLLNVPPEKLSLVCSMNKKMAKISSSFTFVEKYQKIGVKSKSEDKLVIALKRAIIKGNISFYKKWYRYERWDPSCDDNFAIDSAAYNGHTEIVKLILADSRVDPSICNNWTIGIASSAGHTEVVKLLLADSRINPSADNNYAFRYASERGYIEVVKLLLADSRVNLSSVIINHSIRLAILNGHTEVVRLLEGLSEKK